MVIRRSFSLSFILIAVFALPACTTVDDLPDDAVHKKMLSTQSMPKGYRYQDSTPLSSPAPSTPWVKSAVMSNTNKISSSTAAWQGAAYELVDQMTPVLPKDGTALNLMRKRTHTPYDSVLSPYYTSLDHYLRQVLLQQGYTLTTVPDVGTQIAYHIKRKKQVPLYELELMTLDAKGNAIHTETVTAVLPE
jgi:hypothetical protein